MSLMIPTTQMGLTQHNLSATPSISASGTAVTAGAINTKGSYATLIASTNFDAWGFTVVLQGGSTSATQVNNLYDIAIGAAASEVVLIPDILGTSGPNIANGLVNYFFPVFVPAGTRISCRSQSNVASTATQVIIFAHGGKGYPPWQVFSGAVSIGTSTAASNGLAHVAGNTGVESAWTNIGSTLPRQIRAIIPMIGTGNDTTMSSIAYHLEVGVASTTYGEYWFGTNSIEYVVSTFPTVPIFGMFPSGTQMMIRAECSGTAEQLQYALMGFF